MFEHNGQWFILGNRSLNSLNLFHNGIREEGLKALYDAVAEQEASNENAPEGGVGIFRIVLQDNLFEKDNPIYHQLTTLLNNRNPYFENVETEGGVAGEAAGHESAENDKSDTNSAFEEEAS
ncbi:hypothetical protein HK104_004183 [Borealophlyctis nickersoniae]|nr:hypothetical protein HK104_004183 [Borealophlyctis nickersoniae]